MEGSFFSWCRAVPASLPPGGAPDFLTLAGLSFFGSIRHARALGSGAPGVTPGSARTRQGAALHLHKGMIPL